MRFPVSAMNIYMRVDLILARWLASLLARLLVFRDVYLRDMS